MKLAVIFDSRTGNTEQAAAWITEGMNSIPGTEARYFSIRETDEDFVREAKGIVLGSPSYATAMTPDLHMWLQTSAGKLDFPGKMGGAFATEQYTHGGGDLVIQALLTWEMTSGMLCYSGGRAYGKPIIHLGPVGVNNNVEAHNSLDYYKDNFITYGSRFAQKAAEIFG